MAPGWGSSRGTVRKFRRDRGGRPLTEASVLLIEDDLDAALGLIRIVKPIAPVIWVKTAEEAVELMRGDEPLCAIVADVVLGAGGNGLAALEVGRQFRPDTPAMVLTGYPEEKDYPRRAFKVRALFLPKPAESADITGWLLDVLGLDGGLAARQKAAVLEFDRRCRIGLDDRQVEVLVLALRGKDRSEIAAALGRSLGAVKSRLLKILERFRRAGFAVVGLSDVLILIREAPAVLDEKLQAIIGRGGRS